MSFLPGVQQRNDLSRVAVRDEKPLLLQAEPLSPHHKTKRPRPDELPPGGVVVLRAALSSPPLTMRRPSVPASLFPLSFLPLLSLQTFSLNFQPSQRPPLPRAWPTRGRLPLARGRLVRGEPMALVGRRLQVLHAPASFSPCCLFHLSRRLNLPHIVLDICLRLCHYSVLIPRR